MVKCYNIAKITGSKEKLQAVYDEAKAGKPIFEARKMKEIEVDEEYLWFCFDAPAPPLQACKEWLSANKDCTLELHYYEYQMSFAGRWLDGKHDEMSSGEISLCYETGEWSELLADIDENCGYALSDYCNGQDE